eukprot:scaffold2535_cov126-Cylindrotheca_fusiformis.AAC.1
MQAAHEITQMLWHLQKCWALPHVSQLSSCVAATPAGYQTELLDHTYCSPDTFCLYHSCSLHLISVDPVMMEETTKRRSSEMEREEVASEYFVYTNGTKEDDIPKETMTHLRVDSSVTEIPNETFEGCEALVQVQLPEALTRIGDFAFADCSKLRLVQFDSSEVSSSSLSNPENGLKDGTIVFPERRNATLQIDSDAFRSCISLRKIIICSVFTKLGVGVFSYCKGLVSVEFPEGLQVIEPKMFWGCQALTTVKIPSSVIKIGGYAFYGCGRLTLFDLPHGLQEIGEFSFDGCWSFGETLHIPPTVSTIGENAFADCVALKRITLPPTIKRIEKSLLEGCAQLEYVDMPSTICFIGERAFSKCFALSHIRIPPRVESIVLNALMGCNNLKSIEVPEGVSIRNANHFVFDHDDEDEMRLNGLVNLAIPTLPEDDMVVSGWLYNKSRIGSVVRSEAGLLHKLKHRFDKSPLNKLCYYQSYHSSEDAMVKLWSLLKDDPLAAATCEVDEFRMTPLHILSLSQTPNLDMLLAVMKEQGDVDHLIHRPDFFGRTPLDYLCLNRMPKNLTDEVIRRVLCTRFEYLMGGVKKKRLLWWAKDKLQAMVDQALAVEYLRRRRAIITLYLKLARNKANRLRMLCCYNDGRRGPGQVPSVTDCPTNAENLLVIGEGRIATQMDEKVQSISLASIRKTMPKSSFSHTTGWSSGDSSNGMSHHDSSHGGTPEPVVYVPPDVANREEQDVIRSKFLVFFVLLLAVSGAAAATYVLMEEEQQKDFGVVFAGLASEVSTVSRQKIDQVFSALDAYSLFIASEVEADVDSSWPFVLISDYSIKAEKISELLGLKRPLLILSSLVREDLKENWTSFVLESTPGWYQNSLDNEGNMYTVDELMNLTVPFVHEYNVTGGKFIPIPTQTPGPVLPQWQRYPVEPGNTGFLGTGFDMFSIPEIADLYQASSVSLRPSLGFTKLPDISEGASYGQWVVDSQIVQPITQNGEIVGVLWLRLPWREFFDNLNVDGLFGMIAVLRSSCEIGFWAVDKANELSYSIDASGAVFLGQFDAHDTQYDDHLVSKVIVDNDIDEDQLPEGYCVHKLTLDLYPTKELEATFHTTKPIAYTSVVVAIFAFTSLVFLLYDFFVGRRQRKFMERIMKQDQIVSNVFPTAIRDRLYESGQKGSDPEGLFDPLGGGSGSGRAPLADLFPETTIVFADIAGFTSWASAREPTQVFILLETIYGGFDKHAYRHGVFKVETVGDCYVAVAGLPEPDKDHALAVCRFARDCMKTMKDTTLKLEVSLGPDTSDLELRVGIHSGQVTAGVLRGERSRFQLFGDTMNTAARMESTSQRNRIQVSQVTGDLLVASGLSAWMTPREGKIFVKGKGEMQTYWLNTKTAKGLESFKSKGDMLGTSETAPYSNDSQSVHELDNNFLNDVGTMTKTERLVEWNVEVLTSLLQQIIASRGEVADANNASLKEKEATIGTGDTVLEEFVPIIPLKRFDAGDLSKRQEARSIDIGEEAKTQLRNYLANAASMYQNNPFHNFEHASHVTASVKKLLTRIVNVDAGNGLRTTTSRTDDVNLVDMAGHSYGITSDPLTQFSVVFSAIIHDMDHPGVTNAQLVKENTRSAQIFKKSVAEQNSVELAWGLLMGEEYEALRGCIYHTEDDLRRFRQLVVNTVMATDIVDKELQELRKARWETAFADHTTTPVRDAGNLTSDDCKATIVIEHLIQASDVAHTMQHWHIYRSWNEKFFKECYVAYKSGRADSDPSENWYKGEIGFFDYYVIPLAKKLESCGVFGVSSHEYLSYARSNRAEWVREGERLVEEYLAKYKEMTAKEQ